MRSLVPPANRRPPPVASRGPQLNDGRLVVHTFLPVSRSQACSSPMWSDPATIFSRLRSQRGAQVGVGGKVHHPRLRAVGNRRPIPAAPQAGEELGGLACPG